MTTEKLATLSDPNTVQDLDKLEREIMTEMEQDLAASNGEMSRFLTASAAAEKEQPASTPAASNMNAAPKAVTATATAPVNNAAPVVAKASGPVSIFATQPSRFFAANTQNTKPAGKAAFTTPLMGSTLNGRDYMQPSAVVSIFGDLEKTRQRALQPRRPTTATSVNGLTLGETMNMAHLFLASPIRGAKLPQAGVPAARQQIGLKNELGLLRYAKDHRFDSIARLQKGLAQGNDDAEEYLYNHPEVAKLLKPSR